MTNKFRQISFIPQNKAENLIVHSHPSITIDELVCSWLNSEVAKGNAREDTLATYQTHLEYWFSWCSAKGIHPGTSTRQDVEAYRAELIVARLLPATIAMKLTVVRRFYQSAQDRGLISRNPAVGVTPPLDRRVKEYKRALTNVEAKRLIEALPPADTLKGKRDRVIIGLMLIEGLRRVELYRANDEDIETGKLGSQLLVHGRAQDRYKFPRQDTLMAISDYLAERGPVEVERVTINRQQCTVTPLICSVNKAGRPGKRISRIGLNHIIDGYLDKAGLKREQVSCHALRHTCAILLYEQTKDLRAVQEELGYASLNTTAIYTDCDYGQERFAKKVLLSLE